MQIALLINIKWFIRFVLAGFWIVAAYMAATEQGFIMWMLREHASTSLAIFFLSYYYLVAPFYAPFFQVKKRTGGGDVLMERSTKIMLVIVAALLSLLTVMFASAGAREAIINGANNSMFKPAMGLWLGFVNWLDGFRGIYLLGTGIVSGLILAVFVKYIAAPKIRPKVPSVHPKVPFSVQREPAEPEYAPIVNPKPTKPPTSSQVEEPPKTVEPAEKTVE